MYLLPIATHFERHDVALPWYKGHYYIHRPKVIEPAGREKSDFQVFTELAYRLGFGLRPALQPARLARATLTIPDAVDEAYLSDLVGLQGHSPPGRATIDWETFKKRGIYKFILDGAHVAFRNQIANGVPFETASGKIEIFSTELAQITDWTRDTQYG
jgi:anaerobic dimethyl sulfoxide reductase subunit A